VFADIVRFFFAVLGAVAGSQTTAYLQRGDRLAFMPHGSDAVAGTAGLAIALFSRAVVHLPGGPYLLLTLFVVFGYAFVHPAAGKNVELLTLSRLATALRGGREPGQGVGYRDDGTMMMVEDGRTMVGSVISAQVTSVLQHPAGKMILAKVVGA